MTREFRSGSHRAFGAGQVERILERAPDAFAATAPEIDLALYDRAPGTGGLDDDDRDVGRGSTP